MKSAILAFVLSLAPSAFASDDPSVVSRVDFRRYAGLWYEIAHSPNFFQGSCERSTAQYGLNTDGTVSVLNSCYRDNRVHRTIKGIARMVNPASPAKLKVDFGFPWKGDYWVVALDQSYQWAVVSGPGKSSLFILSRKGPMEPALLRKVLAGLKARGFDLENLVYDQY